MYVLIQESHQNGGVDLGKNAETNVPFLVKRLNGCINLRRTRQWIYQFRNDAKMNVLIYEWHKNDCTDLGIAQQIEYEFRNHTKMEVLF